MKLVTGYVQRANQDVKKMITEEIEIRVDLHHCGVTGGERAKKMSWRLAGVALAAAVLGTRAEAGAIRAEVQAVLRGEAEAAVLGEAEKRPPPTPPICYQILETTWWKERKALDPTVANGPMDQACSVWNQDKFGTRDYCNQRETRQTDLVDKRSAFTSAQWNAACTVRGAHDHSCISNPVRARACHCAACVGAVTNVDLCSCIVQCNSLKYVKWPGGTACHAVF